MTQYANGDLSLSALERDEIEKVLRIEELSEKTAEADASMLACKLGFTADIQQREAIKWFRLQMLRNGAHEMWALLKLETKS